MSLWLWRIIMDGDITSEQVEDNQKRIDGFLRQLTAATEEQRKIISNYQKGNDKLRHDNEKKEKEATQLREEVQTHKQNIKDLRAENDKHKKDKVKEAQRTKDKGGESDLQRQLLSTQSKLEKAEKERDVLKCEKLEINNKFQNQIKELERELSVLRQNLKKKDEDIKKQREELLMKERSLQEKLDRQNSDHSQSLCIVQQERDRYKQQVDDWVRQKHTTVHVQMYAAVNKELCERMMNELEDMLSIQFELNNSLIQVEKYKQPPEESPLPLIVLCINASRLGTDVNQALHNVSRTRTVAVIVLHHKEIHALPRQPSEKLLIGSEYKHIGLIVDIAYLTTKGIYPCDMNEKSLDRLVNFIKSNFKT